MPEGSSSFQAQLCFTTAGNGAPTVNRINRCTVVHAAQAGTFTVTTTEDIGGPTGEAADYDLACSPDGAGLPVFVNIKKTAPFTWQLTTFDFASAAAALNVPQWKGSGTLTTPDGSIVVGAIADADAAVAGKAVIKYPLGHAVTSLQWSIFVTANSMAAGAGPSTGITSFTVFKNGVATTDVINVPAGATGIFTGTFVRAYASGDQIDFVASMPGSSGGPQTIAFGMTMDFQGAAPVTVDTTGSIINLTLKRVDPM